MAAPRPGTAGASAALWVEPGVAVPGGRRRLEALLARLADLAARRARRPVSLSLALLSDDEMAVHHARHAGIPGPTDVLSFSLEAGPVLHLELLVSGDTARREARRRGHPAYDEVVLYAVHGVLHLLGHDDHDPVRRRRMRRAERNVLAALGLSPVFRGRRRGGESLGGART